MNLFLIVLIITALIGLNVEVMAKEWTTPEALRAFGKPGDTVREHSNANKVKTSSTKRRKGKALIISNFNKIDKTATRVYSYNNIDLHYNTIPNVPSQRSSTTNSSTSKINAYEPKAGSGPTYYQYNSGTNTPNYSSSPSTYHQNHFSPSKSEYTYYQDGTSSWTPNGSEYTYHQNGTSSWTPKDSEYTYHQDGSSSWTPKDSEYTYHQDGTSSWTPKGSEYTYDR